MHFTLLVVMASQQVIGHVSVESFTMLTKQGNGTDSFRNPLAASYGLSAGAEPSRAGGIDTSRCLLIFVDHQVPFSPHSYANNIMSDTTIFWCLVEGENTVFPVTAPLTTPIYVLKDKIKEERKNGMLSRVDASDLTLWKVRMTMASDSITNSPAG
jgi:hypothetical protein